MNGQPELTESQKIRIRELRNQDLSYLAISKVIGRSNDAVSRFCRRNGLARYVSPNVIKAQQERGRQRREKRPWHICRYCEKEFQIKKPLEATYKGLYCSKKCSSRIEKPWLRNPEKAFKGQGLKVWFKECQICHRLFTARNKNAKACKSCNALWHKIRRRDYIRNKYKLEVKYKCCKYCGKLFITYKERQNCCSIKCGDLYDKQQERARKRNVYKEGVSLQMIYLRDNGRCQICGRKLRLKKRVPHPFAPVRDHIVPISKGGLHEYRNVQLACFKCNLKKGNGVAANSDQLRLW